MKAEELEAIRDDVRVAVINADYNGDPTLLPQLLDKLLTELGRIALDDGIVGADVWAADALRAVQTRAISRIPYGEPTHDDEPEDHR